MEDSKKSGRDTLWKILVCVALLVFLVSGGLTLRSYLADKRAQEEYERLAREAAQTTQETITIEETEKQELETEPEKEEYQSPYDFDTLKKENPDTIGWIHIPDTKISYPIVQGTDNDFYLKHDFNGEASVAGSIYLDYESEGDFEGRNNILYGHNMKNGSMFKDIVRYKDPSYFKEHQYFSIYTPEREIRLKAVSCYYGEAKPIVRKTRFKSQEAFDEFVKEMIAPCSYAETVEYPVKALYTFVTCSYEINDERTFLFAVEADEEGNEITADEEYQQKMTDLMIKKAEEAEAVSKEAGKK